MTAVRGDQGPLSWAVQHERSGMVTGWWGLRADAEGELKDVCRAHGRNCRLVVSADGGQTWKPAEDTP